LSDGCEARRRGIQEGLPVKATKMLRPLKRGVAFVARDLTGAVLLVRRPQNGLLGGMMQPPLGPWSDEFPSSKEARLQAPFQASWQKCVGLVRHGFTHFELEIVVYAAECEKRPETDARWISDLQSVALPTVMKKILHHALQDDGPLFGHARSARKR
jgi:A/G-specific adenine glycosylase